MERQTRQRDAIRAAFADAARPLSPQEAHDLASRAARGLGIATVYRTIKALLEEAWLVPVELPGEPARYEIAGQGHHHHFRCRRCAKVYDIPGCAGSLQRLLPKGFRLEDHDLLLHGRCATCAAR
jgi:Fur family ferric uptake transcriptional regulator